MKWEILLLILSAAIFTTYTVIIGMKYGVQKSISESYYDLPNNWKAVFTLTMWGVAIPVIIVSNTALLFLAGGLIVLVGTAPGFKDLAMTYKAHMIGAYGGIILGFASIAYDFKMYAAVLVAAMVMVILKFTFKNYIWWIEVTAFATILISIFVHILWK